MTKVEAILFFIDKKVVTGITVHHYFRLAEELPKDTTFILLMTTSSYDYGVVPRSIVKTKDATAPVFNMVFGSSPNPIFSYRIISKRDSDILSLRFTKL